MSEISIKVNIADRHYPIRVKPEEEEQVRKAAKLINDRAKVYSESFSVRDKQDVLSMCALELATELVSFKRSDVIIDDGISSRLDEIAGLLEDIPL